MVEYEYGTEMASPVAEAYTSAGEVYEADGVGDLEGAVEGDYAMEGVTAYTRDVVDATGVAAILSEEEEEDLHRQKQRKYLMMGGCLCFVVALAIIIPLVTMGTSKSPDVVVLRTQAPSFAPSPAPSSAPTNEPISEALVQTIQFIRQYDSIAVLETEEWWNNRSSSPYKAARWLSNGGIEKNLKLLQRFALATFYFSTSVNQQWKECSPTYGGCPKEPWLTDADECDWGFVICEKETGKVIGLNFRAQGNEMRGTLPPQLSFLSELQVFSIANNLITGGNINVSSSSASVSSNDTMTADTNLHSIDQAFYGVSSLQALTLWGNQFTGFVPNRIWKTNTGLRSIFLNNNDLIGAIPGAISAATSLSDVQFPHNGLSGSLPSELFTLKQVTKLVLNNNTLRGTLSEEFRRWNASLKVLELQNNLLTGVLPEALDYMTALEELKLEGNDLSGTISPALCARRGQPWGGLRVLSVDCSVECSCCDFYEENCS